MLTEQSGIILGAIVLFVKALGIWFVAWAIRKKGEFDYQMDSAAKLLRWLIVALSFAATAKFRELDWRICRSIALIIGLAFLCWPNFAYRLANAFRGVRGEARA